MGVKTIAFEERCYVKYLIFSPQRLLAITSNNQRE